MRRAGRGGLVLLAAVAVGIAVGGAAADGNDSSEVPQSTWVVSGGTASATSPPSYHEDGLGLTAIALSGSAEYLGGDFSYVGPSTGSFVALDPSNGQASSTWPTVGGVVYAAASDGSGGWYVGGVFASV